LAKGKALLLSAAGAALLLCGSQQPDLKCFSRAHVRFDTSGRGVWVTARKWIWAGRPAFSGYLYRGRGVLSLLSAAVVFKPAFSQGCFFTVRVERTRARLDWTDTPAVMVASAPALAKGGGKPAE
jgi:hypothetical protein